MTRPPFHIWHGHLSMPWNNANRCQYLSNALNQRRRFQASFPWDWNRIPGSRNSRPGLPTTRGKDDILLSRRNKFAGNEGRTQNSLGNSNWILIQNVIQFIIYWNKPKHRLTCWLYVLEPICNYHMLLNHNECASWQS